MSTTWDDLAEVTTTADGRWQAHDLPFGTSVFVHARLAEMGDSELARVEFDTEHPFTSLEMRLRPFAWLDLVVAAPPGALPGTCKVHHCAEVELDATGRGTVELSEEGSFHRRVTIEPFPPSWVKVDLVRGDRRTGHVVVDAGIPIAGHVVDDAGCAVVGATICAERDGHWVRAESDAMGAFRLEHLADADNELTFLAQGHAGASVSAVAPRDHADLRVVLRRHGRISFRLGTRDGLAPPPDVEVCAERLETNLGEHERSVFNDSLPWSEAPSSFEIAAGRWHVVFVRKGFARQDREVDVAPGATSDIGTVVLDGGVPLAGRVLDLAGRPVAGAHVQVEQRDLIADDAGRFVFEHMPARDIGLTVTADGFLDGTATAHPLGGALTVTLLRGTHVAIRVKTEDAGMPSGPKVSVRYRDDARCARDYEPAISGRLELRLPDGRWVVELVRDKTILASREVNASEGGAATLDLAPDGEVPAPLGELQSR